MAQALSADDSPSDPQLGSSAGFTVTGMSPSTSTQMSIVNGTMSTQHGLTAVWTLRATKLGGFTLGPPTMRVGGKMYRGEPVSVRVVPAGQAPARPPPRQNVFDPFGGLFNQLPQMNFPPGFGGPPPQRREEQPQVDPRYALDSARAPLAFLHASIDKPSAVVGEQVTYTVYIYVDTQLSRATSTSQTLHEAPANDFVEAPSLQPDDTKLTSRSGTRRSAGRSTPCNSSGSSPSSR